MKILYYAGWSLTRIISKLIFRIKISGQHHIPESGGFILATNHRSYFDPLLAGSWATRQVYFLAKQELFANKLFGWVITRTNALPVRRGTIDRRAVQLCLEVLSEGYGLTIFPEGTRAGSGGFLPPKPGVGVIAAQAKVPVVPVYIHGSEQLMSCFTGREKMTIHYGEPITIETLSSYPVDKTGYLQIAELVMERIKAICDEVLSLK